MGFRSITLNFFVSHFMTGLHNWVTWEGGKQKKEFFWGLPTAQCPVGKIQSASTPCIAYILVEKRKKGGLIGGKIVIL